MSAGIDFKIHNLINGQPELSAGDGATPVEFPHSGESVGVEVVNSSTGQAERAVEAASAAFRRSRSEAGVGQRVHVLRELSRCLQDHAEDLSILESLDTGKLIRESRQQLAFAARMYDFYAGAADKIFGSTMPLDRSRFLNYTHREPLGVIAVITAWNSPMQLLANKLGPALAAGNAVVIKPSEQASLSTVRLVSLLSEYDIPHGLVNVVVGDHRVGAELVGHPAVAHSTFTGGPKGGRGVARIALEKMNGVTLELGGKSPNIVFEDANVDNAVTGSLLAAFSAAGQTCVAGSRLLVSAQIKDRFLEQVAQRADRIRVGDPFLESTQMGPIGTRAQFDQIHDVVTGSRASQGRVLTQRPLVNQNASHPAGYYMNPQVIDISGTENPLRETEVFGPVLVVDEFSSENEAIEKANSSQYGLASGLWTTDLSRAHRVSRELQAGTVWINTYRQAAVQAPFGGYKESGIGRERGLEAIDNYLQTKNIMIDLEDEVENPYGI